VASLQKRFNLSVLREVVLLIADQIRQQVDFLQDT
jgi:hypothetical protein